MRACASLIVCVVWWAFSAVAQVPAYYIDAARGDDQNTGTDPDQPLRTLDGMVQLHGSLTAGAARVFLAGDHTGSFNFAGTRASFEQWPGRAPARIRGSRDPIADGHVWVRSSNTTYRCEIGPGKQVGNVCARWSTLLADLGRTAGWYRTGVVIAGELDSDQRYFYDPVGGYLYFRDDAIGDPSTLMGDDRVLWQDATLRVGLDVRDAPPEPHNQPVSVRSITFMHFNTGRGASYGLLAGGTGHTVEDCTFYDCEVHGLVFSNTPNVDCHAIRCTVFGAGAGVVGEVDVATLFVTHSPERSPAANIRGCRFIECTAYCYGLQDPRGVAIDPTDSIDGFYGHTSGFGGSAVTDCEWARCTTFHTSNPGNPFYCGDTPLPADPYDWTTYAARAVECSAFGSAGTITTGNIAFQRCFLDFTSGGSFPVALTGIAVFSVAPARVCLLDACLVVARTNTSGSTLRSVYRLTTGARLIRLNCTTINTDVPSTYYSSIFHAEDGSGPFSPGVSGFLAESYGCIDAFVHESPRGYYFAHDGPGNPVAGPGRCYISEGCWISGVRPGHMSQNPAIVHSRDFRSLIDPRAVIGVDPQFFDPLSVDPAVAGRVRESSPILTSLFVPSRRAELGFHGEPFGGRRGAIQRSPVACPCDFNADGLLNTQDFFDLVGLLLAGGPGGPTETPTSADFFEFLACFFAPPPHCQ